MIVEKQEIASHMLPRIGMRLTKATLAKLTVPAGKTESLVFDEALPGFGLRVRAGGKRTWVAQYRAGQKQRRITLGDVEAIDPDEARKRAREVLAKVSLGEEPQHAKAQARAHVPATLGDLADNYLTRRAKPRLKPRSYLEVEQHLKKHWAPLAQESVDSITRARVSERLKVVGTENGPFAANRARAALSALFAWAMGEGRAEQNPVAGTNRPTAEVSRDRTLTDDELRWIWLEAGRGHYASIVRLLMLTGQRREEVGGMLRAEVSGDTWRIGAERAKNRRAHDVPLSGPAMRVLDAVDLVEGREHVFGIGDGPFSGWGNAKAALDQRMLARMVEEKGKKAKLAPWRLHDLRRTVATRMADLGVLPHVVEAVLNHVSGHKAGVAGVYNRASYSAEKRAALDLWGAHIAKLVGEKR